ncbi:MAG TPA: heat-inducible transcriptional repressor HrcA [Methylomirabilota bacterium]|jgi:heat-inducible transcriptional repressor|nr:heat-inducible transcriptional repressor HrcA [Methylomirabilota bacterium]
MTTHALDPRSREVLVAIIAEYVRTAEPVGSRAIARRHIRGLSPATIRNVMADLEEMGYLIQPHTSAGRVPTDKAYRFYVDHLERVPWISGGPAVRREPAIANTDAAEKLMAEMPARLSARTHMTGMLLAPPLQHTVLDRIELVSLAEDRALAVIVTDTGWVTARAISTTRATGEELRETGRALTRRYRGKKFREILDDVAAPADPLDPLWTRSRSLLEQIAAVLRDRTLYLSGAINMLDHPDLSDVATMRSLLRAFEEKAQLIDLLSRIAAERGVQVMIGTENPLVDMRECSLIASSYTYRDQALGVLGVVGPRRMAYSDVIALVDETARLVSDSLSRVKQQLYLPS